MKILINVKFTENIDINLSHNYYLKMNIILFNIKWDYEIKLYV